MQQSKETVRQLTVMGVPRPLFTLSAWEKVQYYVELAPEEVEGMGVVEMLPGALLVTKILLPRQYGGAALTQFSGEDLMSLAYELIEKGELTVEEFSKLLLWWHSHHHMGASFSSHDDHTSAYTFQESPYLMSIVFGKGGRYSCRLDLYQPFRITFKDLELGVVLESNPERLAQARQELQERLSPRPRKKAGPFGLFGEKEEEPVLEDVLTIVPFPGGTAFALKEDALK